MTKRPETSIIMNCHNGEKFLKKAIDSILAQSYKKWELIFWDNRSTDKSKKIFKSFEDKRLRYFYTHKKVSLYESRNAACKKAKGDFIAFLDVDDIWFPNKLKLQVKKFRDKSVGLVYGKFYKVNNKNFFGKKQLITKKNLPVGFIIKPLLQSYPVGLLTIMIRKSFLKKEKEIFRVKYNYLGDLDFVLRFSLKYKFEAVQEPVGMYRQHENQMQRKYFKTKSVQLKKWYEEITKNKTFGSKENLKLFEEWNKFQITSTLIKTKKYKKAISNIIQHPFNINKLKLLIMLTFPRAISKIIISET